ncbi:hypothetical protein [Yersinia kristensenii]|uniref:hypothetical protein n=1 Tax=Yersinia kristensenii TaxID=28152 RepID=UPI0011250415|nr:hypothetical protein [Yersinia kristensenii]EKN4026311.1 hypothetical protein [Yersinia enterocolitica]ELI8195411.1 hypothetical protein [Yersinia enterocolitica]HDL7594627.1 hypothetical protein [Yersinia enterocolitica]HDL7658194.1 hypothetical protein [Yersinia enterocolitica]HDL7662051.1 hypothetical protein [Yersinia enterocolitica]
MIQPKLKSEEYFNTLQDSLTNGGELSEFEYKKILKDLNNDKSSTAICAIGYAHAMMGNNDDAINWFESFSPFTELVTLKAYGSLLKILGRNRDLINLTLNHTDSFKDIWFSWMSMEYYYIIGDVSNSARKAREFLSMLPENKNKERAEYSISQQLDSLSRVYKSGYCTPEQFKMVSDLTLDILDKYHYPLRYVELFYYEGEGASYEIGIFLDNDDFKTLSNLNDELIKRMIKIKELDTCEVTPCFSEGGMSNWRYIHGA